MKIIHKGVCIDNKDPKVLGRIRALLISERDSVRESANEINGQSTYTPWDDRDPRIFEPLFPANVNFTPEENNCVRLIYANTDKLGSKDKYYVPCTPTSMTRLSGEPYDSGIENSDEGSRNKKFKDFLKDGEYFNKKIKGVFAEPKDVALYGKGNSDIILKDNSVILRAGKNKDFVYPQDPESDDKRAFIQLSRYDTTSEYGETLKLYEREKLDKKLKVLVEYSIDLPASINVDTLFNGYIYIYYISDDTVDTSNIVPGRVIPSIIKQDMAQINFESLSLDDAGKLISDTIRLLTEGNITDITTKSYSENIEIVKSPPNNKFDLGNIFPMYYRPFTELYNKLFSDEEIVDIEYVVARNIAISDLFFKVNPIPKVESRLGYGLIYDPDKKTSVPSKIKKKFRTPKKKTLSKKSVNIIGAEEIYLLSHNSKKYGDQKGIDLTNTIYGIDEDKVADEIEPKTSSLVRGEELIDLLRLMKKFLFNHVHAIPLDPPDTVAVDGTSMEELGNEIDNAFEKILNRNIRIN